MLNNGFQLSLVRFGWVSIENKNMISSWTKNNYGCFHGTEKSNSKSSSTINQAKTKVLREVHTLNEHDSSLDSFENEGQ